MSGDKAFCEKAAKYLSGPMLEALRLLEPVDEKEDDADDADVDCDSLGAE